MSKLPLPKFDMPDIPSFPSTTSFDDLQKYIAENTEDISIDNLPSESMLLPASDTSTFSFYFDKSDKGREDISIDNPASDTSTFSFYFDKNDKGSEIIDKINKMQKLKTPAKSKKFTKEDFQEKLCKGGLGGWTTVELLKICKDLDIKLTSKDKKSKELLCEKINNYFNIKVNETGVKPKSVKRKSVKRKSVKRKSVKRKSVKRKSVKHKSQSKRKSVKRKSKLKSIKRKSKPKSIKRKSKPKSVKRKSQSKRKSVKRKSKPKSVKRKSKPKSVKRKSKSVKRKNTKRIKKIKK
jgi:hypothetical protein